jgi:hypothetical protein
MSVGALAKSQQYLVYVIPAQAGIQEFEAVQNPWIPAFAGMTTFCESINGDIQVPLYERGI